MLHLASLLVGAAVANSANVTQRYYGYLGAREMVLPVIPKSVRLVGTPASYDCRNQGASIPIKNQGSCGSCWAFATIGVLEYQVRNVTGAVVDLSEQQLVACSADNFGCGGGWTSEALQYYVANNVNPVEESCYGYEESNAGCLDKSCTHACRSVNCPKKYQVSGWEFVGASNLYPTRAELKSAIYQRGPIAVGVVADGSFQTYKSGVLRTKVTGQVNHAVVLVGWNDAESAWILRNSWGPSWGENGYMRIGYEVAQIGYAAVYATVAILPARSPTYSPLRGWSCLNINYYNRTVALAVRINMAGDTDCASTDGINCILFNTNAQCWSAANSNPQPAGKSPLTCGAMHKRIWNFTGYDFPGHWCNRARELFANGWSCMDIMLTKLVTIAVRINVTGDSDCASPDGMNCILFNTNAQCWNAVSNNPQPAGKSPLTCGAMHQRIWGYTGYDLPGHWCNRARELSASGWSCFNTMLDGMNIAVRINMAGDTYCASTDGINCIFFNTNAHCWNAISNNPQPAGQSPLTCGAVHLRYWRYTGYDNPSHWCNRARELFANGWSCLVNAADTIAVRINMAGDTGCASTDGINCILFNNNAECWSAISTNPQPVSPLTCGAMHLRYWGTTGYDVPGHWCNRARELFASGWSCLNIEGAVTIAVRINMAGDTDCASTDGINCILFNTNAQCWSAISSNPQPAGKSPLTCGAMHRRIWGKTGYDVPGHWCNRARELFPSTLQTANVSPRRTASIADSVRSSIAVSPLLLAGACGLTICIVAAALFARHRWAAMEGSPDIDAEVEMSGETAL